ncbi:MAG: MOSC domain-containing protein [Proteobacteria bacterium]|jgi:uncharacterized protein YcbX|nr:MOSC domain-containing protein [Pseudomonadota bacterium]MDA1301781.1 MOSC domain-containing protein [Pseudomonadota bacterium]
MKVTSLYYYPIKSCGPIALETARVDQYGVVGDREFMVVDRDGKAIGQVQARALAHIQPRLIGNVLSATAPGMDDLPLTGAGVSATTVTMVGLQVSASDMGDGCAEWFSDVISADCRVVRIREPVNIAEHRFFPFAQSLSPVPFKSMLGRFQPFSLHITTERSLADLNARLTAPVPMSRFRPNIVLDGDGVDGDGAYSEDSWQVVEIGSTSLGINFPCERCGVITIDQDTADASTEPLQTLTDYRQLERGLSSKVAFGVYASVGTPGQLSRGDPVHIIRQTSAAPQSEER